MFQNVIWTIFIVILQDSLQVPLIENQPIVFNLFEGSIKQKLIGCISCTPTNPGTTVDLKIIDTSPTVPCGQCFGLWNTASPLVAPNYCVYYVPATGTSLSYAAATSYNLLTTCTDDTGSSTATIEVRITPNSPPYFTSLFETGVISSTNTYNQGDTIFLANGIDNDLSTPTSEEKIIYSMTAIPDEGLFAIGEGDGQIRVTKNMREVCSITSPTELQVYIRDNANTVGGPKRISLQFGDVSVAPSVTNIDNVIIVSELTPITSTIATFVPSSAGVTYNLITAPPSYRTHFTMVGNDLVLSTSLNFEDVSFINITVEIGDGFCVGRNWIGLNILDENDPPELIVSETFFVEDEGRITINPGFVVIDEDVNQNQIFSFFPPNSEFSIDPVTGVISSLGVIDLDFLNVDDFQYLLNVQVSDGFTAVRTTIELTVKDINDNLPVILAASSYSFSKMDCDSFQKLGNILAFDLDRGINGEFEFIGGSNGPLTVTKDGSIYMSDQPATGGYFVDVQAIDHGIPALTSASPVTVSLIVLTCPQSSTTPAPTSPLLPIFTGPTTPLLPIPDGEFQFYTKTENIQWIVLIGLLGLILLGMVLFVIHRLCCAKTLPPFPKKPSSPPYYSDQRSNQRQSEDKSRSRSKSKEKKKEKDKTKKKRDKSRNTNTDDPEKRGDRTSKKKNKNQTNTDARPQPPGPNGYPPLASNGNRAVPQQDDARTMTPFKLQDQTISNNFKPRTDLNSYEFWREDDAVSSRHVKVNAPK